jgi:hypothetical protein
LVTIASRYIREKISPSALHAKTTTNAPKCFKCQNHQWCAQVLQMPKPPMMGPSASNAKTTNDAPKCFTCQNHHQCAREQ